MQDRLRADGLATDDDDEGAVQVLREQTGPALDPATGVVRTSLCVEAREGHLHVFFPPLHEIESWLVLVSAVEAAASECGLPVRLEGYRPPSDYRLRNFAVTPDPGVIEVNIHPSADWQDLVGKLEILYAEAEGCRLRAEKFNLDGRHTGNRRREPYRAGRRAPGRQPLSATAASLAQPDRLLAEPSQPILPVLGTLHRPHEPVAARGRGPRRCLGGIGIGFPPGAGGYRRPRASGQRRSAFPLDRGSPVPPSADRSDGQYPSGRDLHRQTLQSRQPYRSAGSRGVAWLRDAAAPAPGGGPIPTGTGLDRALLGSSLRCAFASLGHFPARPMDAAAFPVAGFRGCADLFGPCRLRSSPGVVRSLPGIPFSALRHLAPARSHPGSAPSRRTLARAGGRGGRIGNGPLRRFLAGAGASQGERLRFHPACGDLQRHRTCRSPPRARKPKRWRACASGPGNRLPACIP